MFVPHTLVAILIAAFAIAVCVVAVAFFELIVRYLYRRCPAVRRFFDRIQFDEDLVADK